MAGPARKSGYPSYASDSDSRFIPEYWSSKLVEKFYGATVFSEISNSDYQGEISGLGDNVVIRKRAPITIRDYSIGSTLVRENPESQATSLSIDKAKYFNVGISDVDEYQSDIGLMDTFTDEATEQMQQVIDTDVLGNIYANADSDNSGSAAGTKSGAFDLGAAGAPLVVTKANVTDFLVDVSTVLGEQNIPRTGRWIVIPEWMSGMIMKSELKDASLAGDGQSIMRNGRLGMIGSLTLYVSNNLNMGTDGSTSKDVTNIIAGHSAGLAFASQITEMEELPNPDDFGRLVRGLNVYGYKVIEPKYLAHAYVTADDS